MKHLHKPSAASIAHLNELLDEALNQTFPASDPIAIAFEFESAENTTVTTRGLRAPFGSLGRKE